MNIHMVVRSDARGGRRLCEQMKRAVRRRLQGVVWTVLETSKSSRGHQFVVEADDDARRGKTTGFQGDHIVVFFVVVHLLVIDGMSRTRWEFFVRLSWKAETPVQLFCLSLIPENQRGNISSSMAAATPLHSRAKMYVLYDHGVETGPLLS